MSDGIDYAYGRPGGAAIAAAGKTFVMRYLSNDAGKNLDAAERDDLHAHGLGIGLVWESTQYRPLDGRGAGQSDAQTALNEARALGFPDDRPIYAAIDFQTGADQRINSYFNGWTDVIGIGRTAAYGGFDIIKY